VSVDSLGSFGGFLRGDTGIGKTFVGVAGGVIGDVLTVITSGAFLDILGDGILDSLIGFSTDGKSCNKFY
jgi:hypothetical protein